MGFMYGIWSMSCCCCFYVYHTILIGLTFASRIQILSEFFNILPGLVARGTSICWPCKTCYVVRVMFIFCKMFLIKHYTHLLMLYLLIFVSWLILFKRIGHWILWKTIERDIIFLRLFFIILLICHHMFLQFLLSLATLRIYLHHDTSYNILSIHTYKMEKKFNWDA